MQEAVKCFRLAVEGWGQIDSQYWLGWCLLRGEGVAQNLVEAVKWLRIAADRGLDDAQYELGCCYSDGKGIDKNDVERPMPGTVRKTDIRVLK
jgi:TPR repeat protein